MVKFPRELSPVEAEQFEGWIRLAIATYLLGWMIDTPVNANGADAKDIKVKAAFDYADKLLKF